MKNRTLHAMLEPASSSILNPYKIYLCKLQMINSSEEWLIPMLFV